MSASYRILRVRGIPIKAHLTLIVLLPLLAVSYALHFSAYAFLWGLLMAVGLFACIALHELGHSMVAVARGYTVREILLLPVGGLAQLDRMTSNPRDEFAISISGPVASLLLAMIISFAWDLATMLQAPNAADLFGNLCIANLFLALFNLLPSFPMDGGRIFRAWLAPRVGRMEATRMAAKVGRIMAIAFAVYAVFTLNFFLLLIALFIYQAAGAEYRMVMIQEAHRQNWGSPWPYHGGRWSYNEQDVRVTPPPYHQGGQTSAFFVRPLRMQHDLFNELFEKWR